MEYLLKVTAIISIFYVCYKAFLQRETFFVANRWFLLIGILVSIAIPLVTIPIYIEQTANTFDTFIVADAATNQPMTTPTFDVFTWLSYVYFAGLVFFFGKWLIELSSLILILKKNDITKIDGFIFVKTKSNLAPFSFFKWIVYNPKQFNENELELIINHEKIHANQYHSIDILISQLATTLFWFNPILWWYKKNLQQNLEFIADQNAQKQSQCEKSYQKLLLKTSLPNHQLAFANNFYNSLIKNRIVMLHKSKSNKLNVWKYTLVLPALGLFIMSFNTKKIYLEKASNTVATPKFETLSNASKVKKEFIITKDFTNAAFDKLANELKEDGFDAKFKGIKRNNKGEITSIKIDLKSTTSNANYHIDADEPIKPIQISLDNKTNSITIGNGTSDSEHGFIFASDNSDEDEDSAENTFIIKKKISEDNDGKSKKVKVWKLKNNDDSSGKLHKNEDIIFIEKSKDGKLSTDTVYVKKDVHKLIWTDDDGKDIDIYAIQKGDKNVRILNSDDVSVISSSNVKVITTGNENPLFFVDGKEVSKKEMEAIDPDTIESVNVLKGDKAIEKHGKKAKDGVVEITLKKKN
ncbi:MAG: M56 family metallopeptidase [Gelidibacter sp.]